MAPTVLWFRRDLRLRDHPALSAAVAEASATGSGVVPLFVHDDALVGPSGANRRAFLAECVADLQASWDVPMVIRRGDPAEVVVQVAEEVGASTVFAAGDCAPYGRRRDAAVAEALEAQGRALVRVGSPYAVSPGRVVNGSGLAYRVFTPFSKAWVAQGWAEPSDAPRGVRWHEVASDSSLSELTAVPTAAVLPTAGEGVALARFQEFLDTGIATYDEDRNRPDLRGTSSLSPYLRFGVVHPRQLLARLGGDRGSTVFRSELAWREFYADVLWHQPDSAHHSLQPVGSRLRWDEGPEADAKFAAWAEGRTGVPVVDAGMRQLVTEGWMHNRVRMLTASYLVKDLHIDWRRGARFFMEHLVDGDLASNSHGWQWVAGTGTDAAPFYRIFNPDVQAARFDPEGAYVARYVPEAGTFGYPHPLVDHKVEREEALARWQEAKEAADRDEAAAKP